MDLEAPVQRVIHGFILSQLRVCLRRAKSLVLGHIYSTTNSVVSPHFVRPRRPRACLYGPRRPCNRVGAAANGRHCCPRSKLAEFLRFRDEHGRLVEAVGTARADMSEPRRSFDRSAFIVRLGSIVGTATWILAGKVHSHDYNEAIWVAGVGYVLLPYLAYLYTRYRQRRPPPRFPLWVAKHFGKRSEKAP